MFINPNLNYKTINSACIGLKTVIRKKKAKKDKKSFVITVIKTSFI